MTIARSSVTLKRRLQLAPTLAGSWSANEPSPDHVDSPHAIVQLRPNETVNWKALAVSVSSSSRASTARCVG